ncbi:MAG: LysR family transcriptional regulator [Zoogloeaceae bacterium]|nr:LysR family transcriptional regulator [Zoogloeaceae bacterium]
MDINLAKTFLEIVRSGSFVAAAERLHVTQTTVTARIQGLESLLGCRLFARSRSGARMTDNGQKFLDHANKLVQTWEAARRDLPLPDGHGARFALGAEVSLCNPILFNWARRLREAWPEQALRVVAGDGAGLQQQLELGALDAALVYKPEYWSGTQVEQVLEEKLIQVCSASNPEPYVYVDWGPEFSRQHDAALPGLSRAALDFNLGPMALQYLLHCGGRGYFRTRVAQKYLESGQLLRVEQAPEFSYPVYLVYSRDNRSVFMDNAVATLRAVATDDIDWSQRWAF